MSERQKKVAALLLRQGRTREAADVYAKMGARERGAQILVEAGDHIGAAELYLAGIRSLSDMSQDERRLASKAAACLAHVSEAERAAELFLKVGDPTRAAAVLERSGDIIAAAKLREAWRVGDRSGVIAQEAVRLEKAGDLEGAYRAFLQAGNFPHAARILHELERFEEAGRLFLDAQMGYQAGQCFARAAMYTEAIEAYLTLDPSNERYRRACVTVIAIAKRTELTRAIDTYLSPFRIAGPQAKEEIPSFAQLAELYEAEEMWPSAIGALNAILRVQAQFPEAAIYAEIEDKLSKLRGTPNPVVGALEGGKLHASERSMSVSSIRDNTQASQNQAAQDQGAQHQASLRRTSEAHHSVEVGALVAKRYSVIREIGRGGMGAVFEALDTELDERVALKFIYDDAHSEEVLERFKQELALSRRLQHPNIVQVFDLGKWGSDRFISMEFLDGADLATRLERGISFANAYDWLAQACAGLSAAHARGVVHRDIKPENLFVTHQNVVKVMDFGIAKKLDATRGITKSGMLAGTPDYIAPEQIQQFGKVDQRADVYAMGCIAYHVFTGKVPFEAAELYQLLFCHVNDEPIPPRERNTSLSKDLNTLILAMMHKDPSKRPSLARVEEFFWTQLAALRRAAELLT